MLIVDNNATKNSSYLIRLVAASLIRFIVCLISIASNSFRQVKYFRDGTKQLVAGFCDQKYLTNSQT